MKKPIVLAVLVCLFTGSFSFAQNAPPDTALDLGKKGKLKQASRFDMIMAQIDSGCYPKSPTSDILCSSTSPTWH